jgi:hypothetical protein
MAGWQPSAGATLLIPSGAGKHLFVVLNNPVPFPGHGSQPCVALVNVSTVRKDIPFDTTCVLPAGCHAFVAAESYVRYQDARIYRSDDFAGLGKYRNHGTVDRDDTAGGRRKRGLARRGSL